MAKNELIYSAYLTVNASEITNKVQTFVEAIMEKANECGMILYVNINTGKPINPPPPPPGNG